MWVNLSLHNNTERATINHVKRNALFPVYTWQVTIDRGSIASCEMLMHHTQFVILISWARYVKRPSSASWSESVSQLNLPFDLAGRRACGRAAPRSKSTWSTRCFDTRRRILTIPVLPEQEIGQTRTTACLCVSTLAPRKVSINLRLRTSISLQIPSH